MDPFKQKIISSIDSLRGTVSGFKRKEIEGALSEGHLFHYKIDRLQKGGKEYTILTTVTVARVDKLKDTPLLADRR